MAEAEEALQWLRGWAPAIRVKEEFESITNAVLHQDSSLKKSDPNQKKSFREHLKNYSRRTFVRPFVVVLVCFFMSNMTGIPTIQTYAVGIFTALGSPIDKYYSTVMLGGAQIVGSISCAGIIHYTGKRPLVILSTLGQSILFGSVAFYAYFYAHVYNLDNGVAVTTGFSSTPNMFSWVPLFGLVGGSLCAFMGARLLPWIIIGEIFPADIRALASGIGASCFYLFAFTANKSFFKVVDAVTLPGVIWFYSGLAFFAAIFYYFFLPETEGWTLAEVEEHFAGHRNLIHAGTGGKTSKGSGVDNRGYNLDDVN